MLVTDLRNGLDAHSAWTLQSKGFAPLRSTLVMEIEDSLVDEFGLLDEYSNWLGPWRILGTNMVNVGI